MNNYNELEKLRKEYENIEAPESLNKFAVNAVLRKNRRVIIERICSICASFLIISTLLLNFVPPLAYAAMEVDGLKNIVKIVTFGRYEYKDNNIEANVVTPEIKGLLDKELENKLNSEFKENAASVISAFEKDAEELKKEAPDAHMSVEFNYNIICDNESYLVLDVYSFTAVGSSSTKHSFYTVNKRTKAVETLKGLFKDNADYITPISDYIRSEMEKENIKEGHNIFFIGKQPEGFDGFEKIKPDQNFYINNDRQLVICFDKYDVAPGSTGCPEFVIPDSVIKNILKKSL